MATSILAFRIELFLISEHCVQDARSGGETKEFAHYLMQSLLCTVQSPRPTLLQVIFKNAEKRKYYLHTTN